MQLPLRSPKDGTAAALPTNLDYFAALNENRNSVKAAIERAEAIAGVCINLDVILQKIAPIPLQRFP
jgi:hypothetical protein